MDALVARYHGKLLDFAFRHLRDREVAADLAQAALVRAFQNIGRYRANSSFRTWLYTITLNIIRDECRRRRVRSETLFSEMGSGEPGEGQEMEIRDTDDGPESIALDGIVSARLWKAVDRLPENQRSAVILKFRQGLTYEEAAESMGVPIGTVKSWVHHAMKTLRRSLIALECEV